MNVLLYVFVLCWLSAGDAFAQAKPAASGHPAEAAVPGSQADYKYYWRKYDEYGVPFWVCVGEPSRTGVDASFCEFQPKGERPAKRLRAPVVPRDGIFAHQKNAQEAATPAKPPLGITVKPVPGGRIEGYSYPHL